MEHITVSLDETTGEYMFLVSEDTRALLDATSTVRRASHVEPVSVLLRGAFYTLRYIFGEYGYMASFTRVWPCVWRVNLSPVNGPILPDTYRDRLQAIDTEVAWLEKNFL